MISDLILGVFAFIFFIQIRPINKYWSLFYLFMSMAALIGSVFHGNPLIGEQYRYFSWSVLTASIVFAQLATYQNVNSKMFNWFFIIKSVTLLSLAISYSQFLFIVLDIAISMLGFIVIGNYFFLKNISNKISTGILISIASAIIVVLKTDIHPEYLTANDIGHYISIISLMYIFKGVKESDYLNEVEA